MMLAQKHEGVSGVRSSGVLLIVVKGWSFTILIRRKQRFVTLLERAYVWPLP